MGKVLGVGGFCAVREIAKIQIAQEEQVAPTNGGKRNKNNISDVYEDRIDHILQDRGFMAQHYRRHGKDYRYAIKSTKGSVQKNDPQVHVNAIVDLAIEARYLAVIRHSNIIKMRAMSTGPSCDGNFFIVLDKLYDTLTVRLKAWKKTHCKKKGILGQIMFTNGKRERALWAERLRVGYDLSCAFSFLHSMNVMYRDIKPDNIGFDVRGDVKVFDFGLAKEYKECDRSSNGDFKFTVFTGSPRYMAPEVFLRKPYNETCDVYSFSILLWQILKVEKPYDGFTESMMRKHVCEKGVRPQLDPCWSEDVTECLNSGWTGHVGNRSSMEEVSEQLRYIVMQETEDEILETHDCSSKSRLSLKM